MSRTFSDIARIPLSAARLLWHHWPALVTLICLGLAGRQGVIWLSVAASNLNGLLPALLMPLAPLSVMTSLILCLWVMQPSLGLPGASRPGKIDRVQLLSIGGLLIPFLTVYISHGLLKEDLALFRRATTIDEYMNQGFNADFSRVFIDNTVLLLAFSFSVVILRKILGHFALRERGLGLATFAAYLEVLWMGTVSSVLTSSWSDVKEWALTREAIAPFYYRFLELRGAATLDNLTAAVSVATAPPEVSGVVSTGASASGLAGTAAALFNTSWDWLVLNLPKLNSLVAVPIAWLTLGAVVFGTTLLADAASTAADPARAAADAVAKQSATPKHESRAARRRRLEQLRRATGSEVKSRIDNALSPVTGPIKTTWKGLGTLSKAGLLPMVVFCLLFVFTSVVELGVVQGGRAIFGPQSSLGAEVLSSYVLIVARAAYLLAAMPLLAAALDFFIGRAHQVGQDEAAQARMEALKAAQTPAPAEES